MFSQPHLRLLSILASFAIVHAHWFDAVNIFGRQDAASSLLGAVTGGVSVQLSTGVSTSSTPKTTSTPISSTPISSTPVSTTSSPSTSDAPSTSNTPTSTSSSTPESTPTSSTSDKQDTTSTPTTVKGKTTTTESPKTTASPSVVVITETIDGKTSVYSSTASVASSTATNDASLSNNDTTKSSGMSTKTRNTVIGVVVGVGGAIIFAGLFVVAWRIWGKKKNEDESDGLMGFRTGSAGHEKTGSASGANPFQSTLDQYHAPNKNVNASSNF